MSYFTSADWNNVLELMQKQSCKSAYVGVVNGVMTLFSKTATGHRHFLHNY